MSQQPPDRYDEYIPDEERRPPRRARAALDFGSTGVRLAATALLIGFGILIVYFALRPRPDEVADTALSLTPAVEATLDPNQVMATFTPGATSTAPPLDLPTAPAITDTAGVPAPGALAVGGAARVANTDGSGANLRDGGGLNTTILQILTDDTPLTLVEGPTEADGFTWWKVRLEDGAEGWLAQDFLAP